MAQFKCKEDGAVIYEDSRKMKIVSDGITYYRVPKPKYKSRQSRLDDALQSLGYLLEELESSCSSLEGFETDESGIPVEKDDRRDFAYTRAEVISMIEDADFSDIESLAEEMEEWQGNMEGTNLELTTKYEEVEECAGYLREGLDELEGLESPEEELDLTIFLAELETYRSELESCVQEMESIYFPGMF